MTMSGKQFLRFGTTKPAGAVALAIVCALASVIPAAAQPPSTATVVWGQLGSFTTDIQNKGGIRANSLNVPQGVALDSSGNLYVADTNNSRVLFYPAGSSTATRVYGQDGSFTSNTPNNGGISANSLAYPTAVAVDSSANLYVADTWNNRVLFFPAGSSTATRVYGQGGSFTSNAQNNGGVSANSLYGPTGVALDTSGDLYVADDRNSRVLYYPVGSTTATQVYGQDGSFTSNNCNINGNFINVNANSLCAPLGVALDSSGNLYVADTNNYRVLFYPALSTTATQVYGQGGSFTSNYCNIDGITADSLCRPFGVALDSSGNLYVGDESRVLFYPPGSTTATQVYGQGGSFTTYNYYYGAVNDNSLGTAWGVAVDSSSVLYVADGFNRVLNYGADTTVLLTPPSPLAFGTIVAGATSSTKAITIKNTGGATLIISKIAVGGEFAVASTTCGSTLSTGKSCTARIIFTPPAPGAFTGIVSIIGNVSGTTTETVTGTGMAQATLTPAPATYAAQKVGTTSAAKTFTLDNKQSVPLTSIAVSATGDFTVSSTTCSTSLAPKSRCQIEVVFTPTATGTRTGTLQISDSAMGSPQTSSLTGTGK